MVITQSTVHSPQSTVHSPQSTVHSPQSTVHWGRIQLRGLLICRLRGLAICDASCGSGLIACCGRLALPAPPPLQTPTGWTSSSSSDIQIAIWLSTSHSHPQQNLLLFYSSVEIWKPTLSKRSCFVTTSSPLHPQYLPATQPRRHNRPAGEA